MTTITVDFYRDTFEFPVIDFYVGLGFDFDREPFDAIAREYHAGYTKLVPECQLHPGAVDILCSIKEANLSQSVLSAYQQQRLEKAIDIFNLRPWFIKLIGLNDYHAHSKIENGKRWVDQLPYQPDEILFVGDTLHDFEVAQAMNVDCVMLTIGHNSTKKLKSRPVKLFDSLNQIADFIFAPQN